MQRKFSFYKLIYFNVYESRLKLLLLTISCILLINCSKQNLPQSASVSPPGSIAENAVNINTASVAELEKLPHIGSETAQKIIEFREKNGRFRRTENLILIHGMSDKKFRELKSFVKVE